MPPASSTWGRDRTDGLLLFRQTLLPAELPRYFWFWELGSWHFARSKNQIPKTNSVVRRGTEPLFPAGEASVRADRRTNHSRECSHHAERDDSSRGA